MNDAIKKKKVKKTCKKCPDISKFPTKEKYLLHVKETHKTTNSTTTTNNCYMCSECAKQFNTRSELTHHIRSKCGTLRLFKCKVCDISLMTAGSLYNHMIRHKGVQSYMCRFCAKQFYTAGQLQVHERIHTQDKVFVCKVCNKGFCHRQSLITHSTLHTGIKPYQCENCGNSFSCVGNLIKHRKTHADTCGQIPLTTHRVKHPMTKMKVKINTPVIERIKSKKQTTELALLASSETEATNSPTSVFVEEENDNCSQELDLSSVDIKVEENPGAGIVDDEDESLKSNEGGDDRSDLDPIDWNDGDGDEDCFDVKEEVDVEETDVVSKDVISEVGPDLNDQMRSKVMRKMRRKVNQKLAEDLKSFIKGRKLGNQKSFNCKYCDKKYTMALCLLKHERMHETAPKEENVKESLNKCSSSKKTFKNNTPVTIRLKAKKRTTELALLGSSKAEATNNHASTGEFVEEQIEQQEQNDNCPQELDLSSVDIKLEENPDAGIVDDEDESLESNEAGDDRSDPDPIDWNDGGGDEDYFDVKEKIDVEESYVISKDEISEMGPNLKDQTRSRDMRKIRRKVNQKLAEDLKRFIKARKLENQKSFNCNFCDKKYTMALCLFKHERRHETYPKEENVKELLNKCSCCKKTFKTKDQCKNHQETIHYNILTCFECDKIYCNTDSLRAHKRTFHNGQSRRNYIYICEKCGKRFRHKQNLTLHESQNCRNGPFHTCPICDKQFATQYTRNTHLKLHGAEKKHLCNFCGKKFHWKGQLKVHERSHTGEKPYTCLFCPKAFGYRESLITHSSLHTGVRPHVCQACGARFSCIGNLIKHKATHAATCGAWVYKK